MIPAAGRCMDDRGGLIFRPVCIRGVPSPKCIAGGAAALKIDRPELGRLKCAVARIRHRPQGGQAEVGCGFQLIAHILKLALQAGGVIAIGLAPGKELAIPVSRPGPVVPLADAVAFGAAGIVGIVGCGREGAAGLHMEVAEDAAGRRRVQLHGFGQERIDPRFIVIGAMGRQRHGAQQRRTKQDRQDSSSHAAPPICTKYTAHAVLLYIYYSTVLNNFQHFNSVFQNFLFLKQSFPFPPECAILPLAARGRRKEAET